MVPRSPPPDPPPPPHPPTAQPSQMIVSPALAPRAFGLIGRMIPAMTMLWMLGGALVGRLVVVNAFRAAFGDPAVARRELQRFPPLRIAEITAGPARVTGRVVAVEPPLASPLAGEACVFHQLQLRKLG